MVTEGKVTELFCIAEDFCQFFDAMISKYMLKTSEKRNYHRDSTMSKAEVMLIMILSHDSGYRCQTNTSFPKHSRNSSKICSHLLYYGPLII